ncbi:MAG: tetratricopeptide repeat protein, partial [Gemmatimonadota bacterium]
PSIVYQLHVFARRNRVAFTAIAAVFVVLVAASIVSTSLYVRAERQRVRATAAEQDQSRERQRAEANFQLAREAVDRMLSEVGESKLLDVPHMEPVRRELLEEALRFYQGFLQEHGSDPAVRFETARAYRHVGDIYYRLAEMEKGEDAFRQAITRHEKLAGEFPDVPEYRVELADSRKALGHLLHDTARSTEAAEQFHANLLLREALVRDFPTVAEYRRKLANAHTWWTDDPGTPVPSHRRAAEILEKLVREHPQDRDFRSELAFVYYRLGMFLAPRGRSAEAETCYADAIALWQELVDESQDDSRSLHHMAAAHNGLGTVLYMSGRYAESEASVRHAIATGEQLAADHPAIPQYQSELGAQLHNLGGALAQQGREEEARALLEKALHHQRAALRLNSLNPQYRRFLANHVRGLTQILTKMGNHVDAAAAVRELSAAGPRPWQQYFEVADYLASCMTLAEQDQSLDEGRRAALVDQYGEQATEFLREAAQRLGDDAAAHNELARKLATSTRIPFRNALPSRELAALAERAVELAPDEGAHWSTLGIARYRAGDWPGAIEALNESMELRSGGDASDWLFLAMAHWQKGDQDQAREWYNRAIEWLDGQQPPDDQLQRFRAEAAELLGIEQDATEERQDEFQEKDPG